MIEPTYIFEGLRGVGRVEISFVPGKAVYVLFGSNGVGKTKCLEALFQFWLLTSESFMSDKRVRAALTQDLLVAQKYEPCPTVLNELTLQGHSYSSEFLGPGRPPPGVSSKRHSLPVVFIGAGGRGHISASNVQFGLAVGTFEQRREQYFDSIVAGMGEHFSSLGMHANLEQWFVTLAQSANPYQKSGDSRKVEIDVLLQLLHEIDSRYDPSFMEIDGANRISLKVDGKPTELRHLSTGFTSLVKVLQAIISGYANFTNEVNLTRVKGIVFIDEIESHLHSAWQAKIVPLLKRLFPNTSFYIATHSPVVLSQLQEGEAYLLRRMDDGVVRTELIAAPNKRAFVDVLKDAFGVDLNQLKRTSLETDDQTAAKLALLALLDEKEDGA